MAEINTQEIKPIQNPNRRNYLKISLPLAGMFLLLGGVYLTVNNALQQQQDNRTQAALGTNMVANPGFESGTGSWQFNRRAGSASYATTTSHKTEGLSSAQLSVTTAGGTPQSIELAQYGKSITSGQTYTVSFSAKAASNRTMDMVIQDANSPYREYMRKSTPLTTSWQQFTYTFTAPESRSNTLVGIQVGSATGTVYVDNVVFATGTGSSVVPTGVQSGNITTNPGCESSTGGWTAWQGTLTRVTGIARTGTASCLVSRSFNDAYTMDDSPNIVKSPKLGEVYTARVWVKSTTAVGKPVRMSIRQWTGSSFVHSFGPYVTLSSSWQEVKTSATITGSDRTEVDVYVVQENAVAGNSFYADDFELYRGNLPTISSAPTAAPTQAPTATKAPTSVPASPTPTGTGNIVFTINKSAYNRGESMTAYWSNIPNATSRDWIGLYTPTAANGSEIGWVYVNCTQTATVAVASGQCTFPIPDTAPNGTLELRLHPNDGNTVLARSPLFNLLGTAVTPALTLVPTATIPPTIFPSATAGPTMTTAPSATGAPTNPPVATNTPVPGTTLLGVNLLLHGLGKGGDAVNAGGTGNMSPLRSQRTVTVDVYDVQNQLVLSKQGTVTFNPTLGNFSGNVDLGTQFNTGLYTVKVKTDQYLRGLVAGIQTITQGQTTSMASLTLVSGDVNNDNAINIVDYNIIVGCYSDLLPPVSCNATNELRADLNDDGNVNQFDYNLFIRELTNLGGQ